MNKTNTSKRVIWFWERIISPHNAWFLVALTEQGAEVVYVTEEVMSADRVEQGWSPPPLSGVRSVLVQTRAAVDALIAQAPVASIHLCDGIRGNGLIGYAQQGLAARGLRQWMVMETVDDSGWFGILKRCEYRRLFWVWRNRLQGILTSGHRTRRWVIDRGAEAHKIFPFAYFLPHAEMEPGVPQVENRPFRFLFVGQFVELKRLDLLIASLEKVQRSDCELVVIGSGPLEKELRQRAESALGDRLRWVGKLPIAKVPKEMARADCLVLPSRHDGWGAVVSEALMVGTPVICSDRCGSAGVVRASGHGGVFRSGSLVELGVEVNEMLNRGRLAADQRSALAHWAESLGAAAGATYLLRILDHTEGFIPRPAPPWDVNSGAGVIS